MSNLIQGRCRPHKTCKFCGAGPETKPVPNQHDPNCLANLPKHTAELINWWHIGHDAKKSGGEPGLFMELDSPEDKAYLMGYRCPQPAGTAAAGRATSTSGQGVGLDLTL